MISMRLPLVATLLAISVPAAGRAAVPVRYRITDLGPGIARDVNNAGQVVGVGSSFGYLYSNGVFTDLGSLGAGRTEPAAINDSGVVVGASATPEWVENAFIYSDGIMTDLGTLGGRGSKATGVNETGSVVGSAGYSTTTGNIVAFLYSGGVMSALTASEWGSYAFDINERGQVAGYDRPLGSLYQQGVIWTDGVPTFLGTLSSDGVSQAIAINDLGQAVGDSNDLNGEVRAFFFSNGTLTDISPAGCTFSSAHDVNNAGQAVGFYFDGISNRAFLYSGGATVDLNSLVSGAGNWHLSLAEGINDAGQIVGRGFRNGVEHGFLATPE